MNTKHGSEFESHRGSVFGWALRVLGRHEDAMDVTQDVCVTWLGLAQSQRPVNARGWLRTVTINRALDYARRKRPSLTNTHTLSIAAPHSQNPDARAKESEMRETVVQALERLSPMQRAVVIAKVFDAETFSQIAQELGIAVPTAKTHYVRALESLAPMLEHLR